jgi:acetolactate synthase-1/2/3 large subunit
MGLPIVVLVFNNGGWGAIANLQRVLYGPEREINTLFRRKDGERYYANVADVARGLGCHAERVEDPSEVGPAIRRALAAGSPAVVEAITDSELPWSSVHAVGQWDITVPAYLGETRRLYVEQRGF